jgi:hypothetical protein
MSKSSVTLAPKERVSHFLYGPGTIVEIGQTYTTIDFDENGRRKFVTTMVQLEPTTVSAPEPVAKKSRAKSTKTTAKTAKAAK